MGSKGQFRHRSSSSSSAKCSAPLVVLLSLVCFFMGSFYGGRNLSNLPDLRQPSKTADVSNSQSAAGSVSGQQQEAGSGGSGGAGGEGSARRQLANERGKVTLPPAFAAGATGDDFFTNVKYQMVSWHPRAYVFPGFASREQCEAIVELAKRKLQPSGLALRKGETEAGTRDIRTSSGTFLRSSEDPSKSLAWVEEKMAKVAMVPVENGEAFNVLRYEIGQHYDSHMDVFDPKDYGPQSSNRIASFLLYLSDVEEGGETMFPYEGYRNMDIGYNFKDCIGLRVRPRMGDALLFWSMFPNGTIDKAALHGSCPVIKGEKWVATKWIRDKPLHHSTGFMGRLADAL